MKSEELFKKFISPSCDRLSFIQNFLNERGLDTAVLQIEGKNHIYVKFPVNQYNSMFKIKTVLAHYDRAAGTPGANDNSAAVFCLMEWACQINEDFLSGKCRPHNIRLIFTDGEEEGESGVKDQGAFALAELFRKLNILDDDIFVFDCMGRGNVPVICENNLPEGASSSIKNRVIDLENKAEKIISKAANGRWFKMPASYSDNASFLANGIPAVAITMLPSSEISDYTKNGTLPYTWTLFHTPNDNFASLTPESFEITSQILKNLQQLKSLKEN